MFLYTTRSYKARGLKGTHLTSLVRAGPVAHYEILLRGGPRVVWTTT